MAKFYFYLDGMASARDEWEVVRNEDRDLAAVLVGRSGTQTEGEDAKGYLYHHKSTPPVAWLYCKLQWTGYVFFRHCPSAPSDWLIISMGLGHPSQAQCLEAVRRFNHSFTT